VFEDEVSKDGEKELGWHGLWGTIHHA
jgi:hypothetical protein